MEQNTKEQIKNRMIKKAASLWGVAANEIEMSFDPIVTLLISACASEIEKISSEVDGAQTRITEKVIQLMTPDSVDGPTPARAILYADPSDSVTQVKPEFQFKFRKEEVVKKTSVKQTELYFSPVQEFNLVNAKVEYIATGNTVIQLGKKKKREILVQDFNDSQLEPSALYIGLNSSQNTIPLEDLSFYFELQDVENEDLFYHHLRDAEWAVDYAKVRSIQGLYNSDKGQQINLSSIFEDVSSKTNNICSQIINGYNHHYITTKSIKKEKGVTESKFDEVEMIFEANKIKASGNIRWIKLVFPRIINNNILKNVYCSLNSFPAMNRELNSFTNQIKEYINILPIKTEDLFFDMKSMVNTEGKEYKARSKGNSDSDKGTFVMRSNNVGKLDKRKAKEYIVHLIELLKDESASFSFLNNDFLHANLKGLNQLISLLDKKVSETSNEITQTSYVTLKPYKSRENLIVEYWTTTGSTANNVKAGSDLTLHKGVGMKPRNSYFMTTSHSGKNDLNMQDRLNSYRRSLLSRDKIVTKEDVKALCHELYGDKIAHVGIERGYRKDISLNKGLVQCIEIVLTPNKQITAVKEEWDTINSSLMYFLEKKSINVFPYKIKILN